MEYKGFKSYSSEGDRVLFSIMESDNRRESSRDLFYRFIIKEGYSAWHIHDGWVMKNGQSGDILHNEEISITWIEEHRGYSHSDKCPSKGDSIIIVKNSPDTNDRKPFYVYCYEVISQEYNIVSSSKIILKRTRDRKVRFDGNEYSFY